MAASYKLSKGVERALRSRLQSPLPPWSRVLRDPLKHALYKQLGAVNLKGVKRVHYCFDPFHPDVLSIRQFMHALAGPKATATNPNCAFKTDIVCDREEPTITVTLESGHKLVFKTALLTTLEIAENFNKLLEKLVRTPEELIAARDKYVV